MKEINYEFVSGVLNKVSGGKLKELRPEDRLQDLPIDSLDLFTVIGELEDATGKSMQDEEFERLQTVSDLVSYFDAA